MLKLLSGELFPAFQIGKAKFLAILPEMMGSIIVVPAAYNSIMADPTFKPDILIEAMFIAANTAIIKAPVGQHVFVENGLVFKSTRITTQDQNYREYAKRCGIDEYQLYRLLGDVADGWNLRLLHRSRMTAANLQEVLEKATAAGTIIETRGSKFTISYPRSAASTHQEEYLFDNWDRALIHLQRFSDQLGAINE
jgi:hypothetical protein